MSVKWKTSDITAVNGTDYEGGEGLLEFDNQETSRTIDIPIFESKVCACFEVFGLHQSFL